MSSHVKIACLAVTAGLILFAIFYFMNIGADRERAKVEKENADAAENADEYITNLGDCRNSGGLYNFETGKCRRRIEGYGWLPSWLSR